MQATMMCGARDGCADRLERQKACMGAMAFGGRSRRWCEGCELARKTRTVPARTLAPGYGRARGRLLIVCVVRTACCSAPSLRVVLSLSQTWRTNKLPTSWPSARIARTPAADSATFCRSSATAASASSAWSTALTRATIARMPRARTRKSSSAPSAPRQSSCRRIRTCTRHSKRTAARHATQATTPRCIRSKGASQFERRAQVPNVADPFMITPTLGGSSADILCTLGSGGDPSLITSMLVQVSSTGVQDEAARGEQLSLQALRRHCVPRAPTRGRSRLQG